LASELGLAATISTVEDPFILAFYADFPVYLSEGATSNLALDVRSSILRAVSEAEIGSVNSLREAIRLTLRETLGAVDGVMGGLDARADRIARTETIKANNGARTEEMKNNGIEKHIWLSSRDSAVRDSHQSLDGDEVEVGQPFSNGLAFPGDHATSGQRPAAEVVNCRCTTIPVVKQESQ
jgi:SPP1 gp7 family putative phage head morphogenesis protein